MGEKLLYDLLPEVMERLKSGLTNSTLKPFNIYAGKTIRLDLDGETYRLTTHKPLSEEKQGRAASLGFTSEDGKIWTASKRDVAASGRDINVLAIVLDEKPSRIPDGTRGSLIR